MAKVYLILSSLIAAAGTLCIAMDLPSEPGDGKLIMIFSGMAVVFLGLMNVANYFHGLQPGPLRWLTIAANIVMMTIGNWITGPPQGWFQWAMLVLLTAVTLFSFQKAALRAG